MPQECAMKPISEHVVLITGATDGIGKGVASALAGLGALVILHGRDPSRLAATRSEIAGANGNDRLETCRADLSSLAEVRAMAGELQARHDGIDLLINNAGVGAGRGGAGRELSADGYELRFAVNHLAPFL